MMELSNLNEGGLDDLRFKVAELLSLFFQHRGGEIIHYIRQLGIQIVWRILPSGKEREAK